MKNGEEIVVFNHCYGLKHDAERTYIYAKNIEGIPEMLVNKLWLTKIHPIYAMLFSLVSEPIKLKNLIDEIADFFDIRKNVAEDIILPFLNRNEPFYSNFGGVVSQFPRNVIVEASYSCAKTVIYTPEEFSYTSIDLHTERAIYSPRTVVFMPTITCTTNCEYCYADRTVKNKKMSFDQVKTIIEECKRLRIESFMLTGGDPFLYRHWKDLLAYLYENGFSINLMSTKTPLQKSDLQVIKKYNILLQFSLDSLEPLVLKSLVGMDYTYLERVKHTFELCDLLGVKFKVATVLTSINTDVKYLDELYEFLKKIKSISFWEIRVANKSLYTKKNFNELKITKEQLDMVDHWVKNKKVNSLINISWSLNNIQRYFKSEIGSKGFPGARCSANYSNIVILPDGKVTICEQLYWNPKYIIGDLNKQSIVEVWNSERAKELAFPMQNNFRDSSPCKSCKIFDECYSFPNRCIVDVIKGYGLENDDFPDPRCKMAPEFIFELRPFGYCDE